MLRVVLFPFLTYIAWTNAYVIEPYCMISINYQRGDLRDHQPLLLYQNTLAIRYPDDDFHTIKIPVGGSIYLACPGDNNYLKNRNWGNEIEAVCVRNKVFDVRETHNSFSSLVCESQTWNFARRMNPHSLPCLEGHNPYEIGFNVNDNFVRTIALCRDDITYTTYYTKFKMSRMIGSYQRGTLRPSNFLADIFYPGINIDQLYEFETQLKRIATILNSIELAKKRLKKSVQFLSRGHLVAKADFVYDALQRSTFWYLNTAPQWQSFNGGNWNSLEMSVRRFAARCHLELDVYTGVHGQMTMLDVHNKQQPVHLHAGGVVMPVPKFFWKVIYDPLSRRGTAFVGLNDPFIDSITNDVYLCTDISLKIKWLDWESRDIMAGISYACYVADLRTAVPTVPELDVIDILI